MGISNEINNVMITIYETMILEIKVTIWPTVEDFSENTVTYMKHQNFVW